MSNQVENQTSVSAEKTIPSNILAYAEVHKKNAQPLNMIARPQLHKVGQDSDNNKKIQ